MSRQRVPYGWAKAYQPKALGTCVPRVLSWKSSSMREEAGEKFCSGETFLLLPKSLDFIAKATVGYLLYKCSLLAVILLGSSQVTPTPSTTVYVSNFKRTRERHIHISKHLCFSAVLWPRMQSHTVNFGAERNHAVCYHLRYLKQKNKQFHSIMKITQNYYHTRIITKSPLWFFLPLNIL